MDKKIYEADSFDAVCTTTREAQCNVQMFAPTIKQQPVQCIDEEETHHNDSMYPYKPLGSRNCVNHYDSQFFVSEEVKKEFPMDECLQPSTSAPCINECSVNSNIVSKNEELSKVPVTQKCNQENSEEAISFIKIEEICDEKIQFAVKPEIPEEHRILNNAGDAGDPVFEVKITQEIQPEMCDGILKYRISIIRNMDKRPCQASGCDTLNTVTQEAQGNLQMYAPTINQESIQCSDEEESNINNYMCGYKSLKSPNCVNHYDDQFCASVEVKGEFPEHECPQSSTAASCINKSAIYSNIVFENEELSKVVETQEIKQEVSEEAFSIIETEEIHNKNDKFITTTEISEEYRILCGGILENRLNSLTYNNEHIKIKPSTLVGNEGNELHKCQCCDEYLNYNNMLSHVDDLHSHKNHKSELYPESIKKNHAGRNVDEIKYKCDSCKRNYKSKSSLALHLQKFHNSDERICKCWCGKQFPTPIQLCQHKKKQHSANVKSSNNAPFKKEFQCDICNKMFNRKDILKTHITSIHYDYGKTFNCSCGKQFRTPIHLYQHKNKQHSANVKCGNNAPLKEFQCDICKKIFKRKSNLKMHLTSIHYDYGKTFNCWCGKQFCAPIYLYRHKNRQHSANVKCGNNAPLKKEFQCDICKKIFISKGCLKIHITSIHYDYGKTFNCWCGKQFRSPRHLYDHKHGQHRANVESANNAPLKNEFQCDICKKFFKSKINLKTHITSIHYDYGETFNCWCGKKFRSPKQLYNHKWRLHGLDVENTNNAMLKNQFQCNVCEKYFSSNGNLKRHIKNIHYDYDI